MTATLPAERSQRLDALRRANEVRVANARAKDRIRQQPSKQDGSREAARMLMALTPELERGQLRSFLLAIPGVGQTRVRKLTTVVGVSPKARLGELTERQRRVLARTLGGLG